MRRPRPAFLAFAKETRKAGNVIGRVLGVTLRHAAETFTLKLGELTVVITVQCGKLKGDYHGLQTLLGLKQNGAHRRCCGWR